MSRADISSDTLFDGRLVCRQYRDGYRFSIDAVLLAHFVKPSGRIRLFDLGAGCGVIALILAYRYPRLQLTALELQESLLDLLRKNVQENGFGARIDVLAGDARQIASSVEPESFDLIVCNPPYHNPGAGRVSPRPQRAAARHTLTGELGVMLDAAVFAVRNRGRVAFIYPAQGMPALLAGMAARRLEPKRLCMVHSYPGRNACLVLAEGVKNGGQGVTIQPPLYIYRKKNGAYSAEVGAYFSP